MNRRMLLRSWLGGILGALCGATRPWPVARRRSQTLFPVRRRLPQRMRCRLGRVSGGRVLRDRRAGWSTGVSTA